ncbi:copper chaperone PCu(A)C, partial [Streptomyces goshikiensis]
MTGASSAGGRGGPRPARRRVGEALSAAIAPLAACSVALAGLTVWTASGAAGSPPRIAAGNGRVFLPYGNSRDTAAFFEVTNIGGGEDRWSTVSSPTFCVVTTTQRRHETSGRGADTWRLTVSV